MSKKIRATISEKGVGKNRYEVIKDCIERYKSALDDEYYLEAIALIESLIADRMESRITELNKLPHNFDTLNNLKTQLSKIETSKEIKNIINKDLNSWMGERNTAIHQSAKIEYGKPKSVSDHYKIAKITAEKGYKIFRALDKEINKLRRVKAKNLAKK